MGQYCWWKKSCTSWYGKYPIICRGSYIPGGAGFLPWRVSIWNLRFQKMLVFQSNPAFVQVNNFLAMLKHMWFEASCMRMLPRVITRDKIQKVKTWSVCCFFVPFFWPFIHRRFCCWGQTSGDAFCVFFFAGERDDTNLPSFSSPKVILLHTEAPCELGDLCTTSCCPFRVFFPILNEKQRGCNTMEVEHQPDRNIYRDVWYIYQHLP